MSNEMRATEALPVESLVGRIPLATVYRLLRNPAEVRANGLRTRITVLAP